MIPTRHLAASFMSAAIATPVIFLLWIALSSPIATWLALFSPTIITGAVNTFLLCAGVAVLVCLIGVGTAWLVVAYQFKSRHILSWALLLPLAIPAYIEAYVYLDLLHPLGPIQSLIRETLGYSSPKQWRFADLRGLPMAILLLGFVLYPYVYLSTRAMFMTQPGNLIHAARGLGLSEFAAFRRVVLPMARPAIAIGLSLALLETINDIGASEFLGVRTLTVEIYTNWNTKGDLVGGARISILLLTIILIIAFFLRDKKNQASYRNARGTNSIEPRELSPKACALVLVLGWLPVLVGFIAPCSYLIYQIANRLEGTEIFTTSILEALSNSVLIASSATLICMMCAIIFAWSAREPITSLTSSVKIKISGYIGKIGYTVPGTMLAIGLITPYGWLDRMLNSLLNLIGYPTTGLLILGSTAGVACACAIRFIAIAIGNLNAGMARIPSSIDQAARGLGATGVSLLFRVHLPIIQPAIIASTLLIFVECLKELPVTLMLRPLNTETLSTLLYADASRGNYEESALAALLIVLAGIVPVILLTRIHSTGRHH